MAKIKRRRPAKRAGDGRSDKSDDTGMMRDDAAIDSRIMKRLALQLAEHQLASKKIKAEVRHKLIAKFVRLYFAHLQAENPNRKKANRGDAILKAMQHYDVGERTVEMALSKFPATK
jgi:hypothetical protein